MKILITVILIIVSFSAAACFPAKISEASRIESATNISIGFVTGMILEQFEDSIADSSNTLTTTERIILRVKITQALKGKHANSIVSIKIGHCGSGKAELRQKVITFFDGNNWFVTAYDAEFAKRVTQIQNQK